MDWVKALTIGRFRRMSLQKKMVVLITSTVLVVLVFCFVVFSLTISRNIRNREGEYLENSYLQKKESLDEYMHMLDFTAYTIMYSNWAQQLLSIDKTATGVEKQIYYNNATHFLSSLASINNDISFVLLSDDTFVWNDNTHHYDQSYDIEAQPWYSQLIEDGKYIEYGSSVLFEDISSPWSMTLYYPVKDYYQFSTIGYLGINITPDKLSFLASSGINESVMVTDRQGRFITGQLQNSQSPAHSVAEFEEGLAGPGGQHYEYTNTLLDGNWNIRILRSTTTNPLMELGQYSLYFLLLIPIAGAFIAIAFGFSQYLSRPIVKCKDALLAIRNNHFGVTVENHYYDEIGELVDGLNEMSGALVTLLKQNERMDALRRRAELEMLQQKVNPHFLYNTLEIINGLILSQRYDYAVKVCEMLGQIYHYNLTNHKWVTLREEYEYVQRYLEIIHHKQESLQVIWEIDEGVLEQETLRLVLQPLVENSVRHGFRLLKEDCCLTLGIHQENGGVKLTVMDNGAGIPPERLAEIEQTLEDARYDRFIDHSNGHIGVRNVYQRLYLEYGSQLVFKIESREHFGTKTTIWWPLPGADG